MQGVFLDVLSNRKDNQAFSLDEVLYEYMLISSLSIHPLFAQNASAGLFDLKTKICVL